MFDSLFFDALSLQQLLTQFHFIRPLWLIAFIPTFLLLWLRWREETKSSWKDILPTHLRTALTIGETGWRKQLPLKLLMVIVTTAIVICAGPSWQREASPFGEDKASMLVVLDNSESMLSKDLPPNRLERAKQKIRDLLSLRKGGSTGLVVYSGSAHIAMPVTQDSKVFAPFLAAITPEIMPIEGKYAEKAIPLFDPQLSGELGSSILLVTDGVNPATIQAYEAYFEQSPHQLLILAAGNRSIASKNPIDWASLQALASKTGGRLFEISVDDSDVQALNRAVERNMQMNGESSMPWKDMGYGLLIPMAFIMLLWFRKGWLVQWCLIGFVISSTTYSPNTVAEMVHTTASSSSNIETLSQWDKTTKWWWDLWLTPDQQGQRLFNQQQYLEAAKRFDDPLRKGAAYYYASEYTLAHSAFLQVESSAGVTSDLGLYNAASALGRQREYLAARDLLEALSNKADLAPNLKAPVQNNLAVFKSIIEEVNRTSESQSGTTDGPEESFELDEDQPRTGDGAEENTAAELLLKETLNAREILGSDELADKWLRRVEADPKYFLRAKFHIQLRDIEKAVNSQKGANE
ncbi:VWA domain-containing protein [Vibrio sp. ZSDE26]|uniref:VWA domain-containing protein n=1 Tax=Vibrio amylolyticus TaxID=2847292 RepID=A0A9X2BKF3_9VIBR|nr:VWA domain-containing protein [Vibrio amylolyticus]MCK6262763.1 VWA domain-containing protein [Vibrio amylolyticus]